MVEPMLWLPVAFIVASVGSAVIGSGCSVVSPGPGPVEGVGDADGVGAGVVVVDAPGAGSGTDGGDGVGSEVAAGAGVSVVAGPVDAVGDALAGCAAPVATPAIKARTAIPVTAVRMDGRIGKPFETSVVGGRKWPSCQAGEPSGDSSHPPR
jgi:hypothetical protein